MQFFKRKKEVCFIVIVLFSFHLQAQQKNATILSVPGSNQFCKIDSKGISVLPSGRYLTPAGK